MNFQDRNIIPLYKVTKSSPIKEELIRQNKTAKWLAVETGLSQTTISRVIKGISPLQARSQKTTKICKALNIDLNLINRVGK